MSSFVQALFKIGEAGANQTLIRMTTLNRPFTFFSEVYSSLGSVESITFPEHSIGEDTAVLSFSISLASFASLDAETLEGLGPAVVRLWIIRSADGGLTWKTATADFVYQFTGRVSRSIVKNNLWTVEAEPTRINKLKLYEKWDGFIQRQSLIRNNQNTLLSDRGLDYHRALENRSFRFPDGLAKVLQRG